MIDRVDRNVQRLLHMLTGIKRLNLVKGSNDVNLPCCSGKRIIRRIEFKLMEGKGKSAISLMRAMNDL